MPNPPTAGKAGIVRLLAKTSLARPARAGPLGEIAMRVRYFTKLVAGMLLLISAGCISDREWRHVFEPYVAVVTCPGLFYADCHRWPRSREELATWAAQHDVKFPNARYTVLTFEAQSDGSLRIHYEADSVSGDAQIGPVKVSH